MNQSDYKALVANQTIETATKAVSEKCDQLFALIFAAVRHLRRFKTLVLPTIGGAALWPGGAKKFVKNIWLPCLLRALSERRMDPGLSVCSMEVEQTGTCDVWKELQGAGVKNLGRFPEAVAQLDDPATTLIVNAWNSVSVPGNGNEEDNSLDGRMGRLTCISVVGTLMTNPYMLGGSNVVALKLAEEKTRRKFTAEEHKFSEEMIAKLQTTEECHNLGHWTPIKVLAAGGMNSQILQVCDPDSCDFVLKMFVSEKEADMTTRMGKVGIAPAVLQTIPCKFGLAMVEEKMDGDLSALLYPPEPSVLDEIMPQVLDLIYQTLVTHGIRHYDTKVNNFLWRREKDDKVRVFLADFGNAHWETVQPEQLKAILLQQLQVLNESFVMPKEHGVQHPVARKIENLLFTPHTAHHNWVCSFMSAEKKALASNSHWHSLDVWNSVKYSAVCDD